MIFAKEFFRRFQKIIFNLNIYLGRLISLFIVMLNTTAMLLDPLYLLQLKVNSFASRVASSLLSSVGLEKT